MAGAPEGICILRSTTVILLFFWATPCLAAGELITPAAPAVSSTAPPPSAPAVPREEMIRRMVAWTGLPARQIVSFGDGVAVALVDGPPSGARTGLVKGLALRGEAVDEETAVSLGWRSMRSTVDIDCDHGRDLVRSMEVFADHDLKGASGPKLPGTWGQPDRLAYLGAVISAVCKGGSSCRSGGLAAAQPAAPARRSPSRRSRRSHRSGRHRTPPRPLPRPQTASGRKPVSAPTTGAGPVVQIAAGGSEEGARRALASLQAPGLAGLTRSVQMATKDGKPLYRAVVGGFTSRAAAVSFCQDLQKTGHACLVR